MANAIVNVRVVRILNEKTGIIRLLKFNSNKLRYYTFT